MVMLKQRNDPVRLLWRRIAMAVLIIIIFFAIWAVWGIFWKERESAQLRAEAENQLSDLTLRQKSLTASINSLETDRGKEEMLRTQYGVAKAGEGVIQIIDSGTPSATPTTTSQTWLDKAFSWW